MDPTVEDLDYNMIITSSAESFLVISYVRVHVLAW